MADADAVLTVLGSGTLEPSAERASAAHHLRAGSASILIDCGPGTVHGLARHGIAWQDLTHVVLSHYHHDHLGDLPAVMIALRLAVRPPRGAPLRLVGPVGLEARLRALADALGTDFLSQDFDVEFVEVAPGAGAVDVAPGSRLSAHATRHTDDSLAYRVSGPWGSVGYTGDTGPTTGLAGFLTGVSVLVSECSHPDPPPVGTHLTPATLARLAGEARPGVLVVTHVMPPFDPAAAVRGVRERYEGVVVEGRDGLRVALRDGAAGVDLPIPVR